MKYKEGDKVKIRGDLLHKAYGSYNFIPLMDEWRNKIVTISRVCSNYYLIDGDERLWRFTDEMIDESLEDKTNKEKIMKNFKIVDYKVYEDRAVVVTFEDGTEEKAVCCESDKFDLERAIEVAVLKHVLGANKYKSVLKSAIKQVKEIDKSNEQKEKEKEIIARKKAKNAERKARYIARKRQERIDEMTEAYFAAMKKYNESVFVSCDNCDCEECGDKN